MQNMTETPSEMSVATACTAEKRRSDPSLAYWRVSALHHCNWLFSLTGLPIRETTTVFKDSPDVTASSSPFPVHIVNSSGWKQSATKSSAVNRK